MSKVTPYKFFHLKDDELRAITLKKHPSDKEIEAQYYYRQLASKTPFYDSAYVGHLPAGARSKELKSLEADNYSREANAKRYAKKAKAASNLKRLGYYTPVANVKALSMRKAILMTVDYSTIWNWWDKNAPARKSVTITGEPYRSTSTYDICEYFGEPYLLLNIGYLSLADAKPVYTEIKTARPLGG